MSEPTQAARLAAMTVDEWNQLRMRRGTVGGRVGAAGMAIQRLFETKWCCFEQLAAAALKAAEDYDGGNP